MEITTPLTIIALVLMFIADNDTLGGLWKYMWALRLVAFNNAWWFMKIFMGYTELPKALGMINVVIFVVGAVLAHMYHVQFKVKYREEFGDK